MSLLTEHNKGRPRSPDSILMGIKAIVLEALRTNRIRDPWAQEYFQRILASYKHGTKFAQGIYLKKIEEIEALLHESESN